MAAPTLTRVALSVVACFIVSACASVLDIETATDDPALDNPGPKKSLCQTYCDTLSANCNGNVEQFVSTETCLDYCAKLDPGKPNDTAGDTVNCRLHYATSAKTAGEKADNCSAAGPGGNGTCGTNCDALCHVALQTCGDQPTGFKSETECTSECTKLPDKGEYDDSIQDGFTIQCRLYHVSAAQIDPVVHCPHVRGILKCSPPAVP